MFNMFAGESSILALLLFIFFYSDVPQLKQGSEGISCGLGVWWDGDHGHQTRLYEVPNWPLFKVVGPGFTVINCYRNSFAP